MPNAGKSSLFNALTKAGAEAANYPFTTIEPNVAVVPVRDERLERGRARRSAPRRSSGTRSTSTTSPGLVAGAHKGEGLGNRFLANIRETDAIVHVVRAHGDENVSTPRAASTRCATSRRSRPSWCSPTSSRPSGALERVARQARGGDRAAVAEEAWLREVIAELQAGPPGARRAGARGGAATRRATSAR